MDAFTTFTEADREEANNLPREAREVLMFFANLERISGSVELVLLGDLCTADQGFCFCQSCIEHHFELWVELDDATLTGITDSWILVNVLRFSARWFPSTMFAFEILISRLEFLGY